MFTKLYLETTNPKLTLSEFFSPKVLTMVIFSVLFHTIIYLLFFNIVSLIFFGKVLSSRINARLVGSLLLIMFFGFIGRLLHTKEIYAAYDEDMKKTRKYIDNHYISWVFIS